MPKCETVNEEKCDASGKCESWPREVCQIVSSKVVKTTPKSGCDKVPRTMCYTANCDITEVTSDVLTCDVLTMTRAPWSVTRSPARCWWTARWRSAAWRHSTLAAPSPSSPPASCPSRHAETCPGKPALTPRYTTSHVSQWPLMTPCPRLTPAG